MNSDSASSELEPDWASAHNGALAFSIVGRLEPAARLLDAALAKGTPVEESKRLRLSIFVRSEKVTEALELADTLQPTPRNAIYRADLIVKTDPVSAESAIGIEG